MKAAAIVRRPDRETVDRARPGDVVDGQYIGIPRIDRVTRLAQSLEWLQRARQHLIVDGMSAKVAAARVSMLARRVRAIARLVARRGWHVSVHSPSSLSGRGPSWEHGNVYAVLWLTDEQQIAHEVTVDFRSAYRLPGSSCWHVASRADVLLRRLDRTTQPAQAEPPAGAEKAEVTS